jgi:NAD(P)-dependent dehydrogenase (short-subunit alcohol dehydrogenase family)
MVARVRHQLGPIDLLVNNAGIATRAEHADLTFADWRRMFEVNLNGPFLTTWAVKDDMIARRYGRIVNVSSLAGLVTKPDMIHYATTKAALIAFTRHCAAALAPDNVRVNCVAPGLTNTDLASSADPGLVEQLIAVTPLGRIGEPAEIAAVVKFLLSDDSSFVTGQTVPACGGRC